MSLISDELNYFTAATNFGHKCLSVGLFNCNVGGINRLDLEFEILFPQDIFRNKIQIFSQ